MSNLNNWENNVKDEIGSSYRHPWLVVHVIDKVKGIEKYYTNVSYFTCAGCTTCWAGAHSWVKVNMFDMWDAKSNGPELRFVNRKPLEILQLANTFSCQYNSKSWWIVSVFIKLPTAHHATPMYICIINVHMYEYKCIWKWGHALCQILSCDSQDFNFVSIRLYSANIIYKMPYHIMSELLVIASLGCISVKQKPLAFHEPLEYHGRCAINCI